MKKDKKSVTDAFGQLLQMPDWSNPFAVMSKFQYLLWYNNDVKPNLTQKQKEKLMMTLSELSLRTPLMAGVNIPHSEVPELKKFSHTEDFTGLQLYVVFTELFREIHPEVKL